MAKQLNTYKVLVSTVYTVHAKTEQDAITSMRNTIKGGIFNDNVTISSQMACLADPEDPFGSMFDPNNRMNAMSFFRLGNEQLG